MLWLWMGIVDFTDSFHSMLDDGSDESKELLPLSQLRLVWIKNARNGVPSLSLYIKGYYQKENIDVTKRVPSKKKI